MDIDLLDIASCGDVEEGDDDMFGDAEGGASSSKDPRTNRGEGWCTDVGVRFSVAGIFGNKVHIGWGALFGLHVNSPKDKCTCKKNNCGGHWSWAAQRRGVYSAPQEMAPRRFAHTEVSQGCSQEAPRH